eukprot:g1900.t1
MRCYPRDWGVLIASVVAILTTFVRRASLFNISLYFVEASEDDDDGKRGFKTRVAVRSTIDFDGVGGDDDDDDVKVAFTRQVNNTCSLVLLRIDDEKGDAADLRVLSSEVAEATVPSARSNLLAEVQSGDRCPIDLAIGVTTYAYDSAIRDRGVVVTLSDTSIVSCYDDQRLELLWETTLKDEAVGYAVDERERTEHVVASSVTIIDSRLAVIVERHVRMRETSGLKRGMPSSKDTTSHVYALNLSTGERVWAHHQQDGDVSNWSTNGDGDAICESIIRDGLREMQSSAAAVSSGIVRRSSLEAFDGRRCFVTPQAPLTILHKDDARTIVVRMGGLVLALDAESGERRCLKSPGGACGRIDRVIEDGIQSCVRARVVDLTILDDTNDDGHLDIVRIVHRVYNASCVKRLQREKRRRRRSAIPCPFYLEGRLGPLSEEKSALVYDTPLCDGLSASERSRTLYAGSGVKIPMLAAFAPAARTRPGIIYVLQHSGVLYAYASDTGVELFRSPIGTSWGQDSESMLAHHGLVADSTRPSLSFFSRGNDKQDRQYLIAVGKETISLVEAESGTVVAKGRFPGHIPIAEPRMTDFDGDGVSEILLPTSVGLVGVRVVAFDGIEALGVLFWAVVGLFIVVLARMRSVVCPGHSKMHRRR